LHAPLPERHRVNQKWGKKLTPPRQLIITHNYSRSLLPAWKPATSKVRS
jgi:hypothetical protein